MRFAYWYSTKEGVVDLHNYCSIIVVDSYKNKKSIVTSECIYYMLLIMLGVFFYFRRRHITIMIYRKVQIILAADLNI